MIAKYEKEIPINPSCCDSTGRQSADHIFDLFIDIAGEHAALLGIGAMDLMKKGLYWVVAKSKVRFYERPGLYDNVTAATWAEAGADFRCFRDYTIEKNGQIIVAGRHQWAVIGAKDGKPINVSDILPAELEYPAQRTLTEDFNRITGEFSGEPFAEYKVRSTDIDFVGHMNNVAYIRAFESIYTCKEWKEMNPFEIEVSYAKSCYEGDTLLFTKRKAGDNKEEILAHLPNGEKIAYFTLTQKR